MGVLLNKSTTTLLSVKLEHLQLVNGGVSKTWKGNFVTYMVWIDLMLLSGEPDGTKRDIEVNKHGALLRYDVTNRVMTSRQTA